MCSIVDNHIFSAISIQFFYKDKLTASVLLEVTVI